jgi:RimJ/RimL family protein N-acetyltransferase
VTLRLERWTEDDLPLVQALFGDPEMMEHLGGPESPEKLVERHKRYMGIPTAFKLTLDGTGVGWIGYWQHEWEGEEIYETGWSVLPAYQGRGIASAGTRLALDAARASDGPRVVHAFPVPDNAASNAVCRKLGFTFVREVSFEFPKGHWAAANDWKLNLDAPAS